MGEKLNNQHYKNMSIRPEMETLTFQAESIAFVVSDHLNIDTSQYSFGYLASWSRSKELDELKKSLSVIQSESNKIINEIDNILMPEQNKERFSVVQSIRNNSHSQSSNKASEKLPAKTKSLSAER